MRCLRPLAFLFCFATAAHTVVAYELPLPSEGSQDKLSSQQTLGPDAATLVSGGRRFKNGERQTGQSALVPLLYQTTQSPSSSLKNVEGSGCEVRIRGENENTATVTIKCDKKTVGPLRVDYKKKPHTAPDTSDYGFQLFKEVDDLLYAIVINPKAKVVIKYLEVAELHGLGAVFYVDNARLSIDEGVVRNIRGGRVTGVLFAKKSSIHVSDLESTDNVGQISGFLVADGADIEIKNSVFEEHIGSGQSFLFSLDNLSELTLEDTHMKGSLPHSDATNDHFRALTGLNFEAAAAESGVAFVRGKSRIIAINSLMECFPSIKGTVYLEDSSTFESIDSKISDNLALYGGAVHAQDSFVKWDNVHAHRNSASRGGAVLLHGTSSYDFSSVYFEHNLAIQGGGMFIEVHDCEHSNQADSILMHDCVFERNTALSDGGAIFSACVSLNIASSTFFKNGAENRGGAVFLNSSTATTVSGSQFVLNQAAVGGAMAIYSEAVQGDLWLHDAVFLENKASSGDGGAILFQGSSSAVDISSSLFDSNVAGRNGGGVCVLQTWNISVDSTVFANNTATKGSGGSLCIVENVNLSLNETNFDGGNSFEDGGELFVMESAAVTMENVLATNSKAGGDGGAFALSQVGHLSMSSSKITECKAERRGGGVSFRDPMRLDPVARTVIPSAVLRSTNLNGNKAEEGGGVFVTSVDTFMIENCSLSQNRAVNGGGIHASELLSLSVSGFVAEKNRAEMQGGALYASAVGSLEMLPKTAFLMNDGGKLGGAIYAEAVPAVAIQNANFSGNRAKRGSGGAVGLFGVSTLHIEDRCSFERNRASGSGGAIYLSMPKQLTVAEATFSSNQAMKGDGGAFCFLPETTSPTMDRSLLHSTMDSDRINVDDIAPAYRVSFAAVSFYENSAKRNGGAVFMPRLNGSIQMEKTYFEACTAEDGSGGCVYFSDLVRLKVIAGDFEKSSSGLHGGCLFLSSVLVVDIDDVKFDACVARFGKGGALHVHGSVNSTLHATDGVLTANMAAGGGAYFIKAVSKAILDESKFYENRASDGSGGAVDAVDVVMLQMRDMRMDKNIAFLSCGAFCATNVTDVTLSGVFTANNAGRSGGVSWMQEVQNLDIRGTYSHNKADRSGGAFQLTRCTTVVVDFVAMDSNYVYMGDGGALSVHSVGLMSLSKSNLTANEAVYGGGVALEAKRSDTVSTVRITNCTFSYNKARRNGGGLLVKRTDTEGQHRINNDLSQIRVDVNSSLFERNEADRGGGVAVLGGQVFFEGSNFTGNHANRRGGGFYFDNSFFLIVLNDSLVTHNSAEKGGAMAVSCHTRVNFTNALVGYNAASRRDDGALYSCEHHGVYFENVTFVHNFRNHEWYYYVVFVVGGYALLLFFLGMSAFVIRRWIQTWKMSIVVHTYSDIGEHDPEAPNLPLAFSNPAMSTTTDDEPVVAPKQMPSVKSAVAADFRQVPERDDLESQSGENEIKESNTDESSGEPIALTQFPEHL